MRSKLLLTEDATLDDLTPKVQQKWDVFVEKALGEITAVLQSATWLWEETQTEKRDSQASFQERNP